jgi:hypothetical protein
MPEGFQPSEEGGVAGEVSPRVRFDHLFDMTTDWGKGDFGGVAGALQPLHHLL